MSRHPRPTIPERRAQDPGRSHPRGRAGSLDIIAQLNDRTVTEEIRFALEAWIKYSKSDPSVLQRAQFVRDQIEREAVPVRALVVGTSAKVAPISSGFDVRLREGILHNLVKADDYHHARARGE